MRITQGRISIYHRDYLRAPMFEMALNNDEKELRISHMLEPDCREYDSHIIADALTAMANELRAA